MKRIISALIVVITILSLTTISMAAELSVALNSEKEKVEQGTEIKISLIVNNFTRTGTQKAIEAKVEYDNTKLEYKGITWTNGWTGSVSADETGIVASKSSEVKESEVIAEITYFVKTEAEEGKTEIKASQILTSADGDEVEANDTKAEIEIVKKAAVEPPVITEKTLSGIEITEEPTKTTYTEGEKFDKTGMVIKAKYSDGTSKEITGYTWSPDEELKVSDEKITISYTEEEITKTAEQEIKVIEEEENPSGTPDEEKPNGEEPKEDKKEDETLSDKEIPDTGIEKVVIPVLVIALLVVALYIGYRKYKNI